MASTREVTASSRSAERRARDERQIGPGPGHTDRAVGRAVAGARAWSSRACPLPASSVTCAPRITHVGRLRLPSPHRPSRRTSRVPSTHGLARPRRTGRRWRRPPVPCSGAGTGRARRAIAGVGRRTRRAIEASTSTVPTSANGVARGPPRRSASSSAASVASRSADGSEPDRTPAVVAGDAAVGADGHLGLVPGHQSRRRQAERGQLVPELLALVGEQSVGVAQQQLVQEIRAGRGMIGGEALRQVGGDRARRRSHRAG